MKTQQLDVKSLGEVKAALEAQLSSPTFDIDDSAAAVAQLQSSLVSMKDTLAGLNKQEDEIDEYLTKLTQGEIEAAAGFGAVDPEQEERDAENGKADEGIFELLEKREFPELFAGCFVHERLLSVD